jgi:hypothetical protein
MEMAQDISSASHEAVNLLALGKYNVRRELPDQISADHVKMEVEFEASPSCWF